MTATEKRYGQTEKDALVVHWAKYRSNIYLVGASKVKISTAHKPLRSLFNKETAQLPLRIEIWVLGMQDVDFELVYKPGIADPRTSYKTPITKEKQWCHRESLQVRCEG